MKANRKTPAALDTSRDMQSVGEIGFFDGEGEKRGRRKVGETSKEVFRGVKEVLEMGSLGRLKLHLENVDEEIGKELWRCKHSQEVRGRQRHRDRAERETIDS